MGDEGFMQCTSNGTSVTGELMQMSTINCASLVYWLHANVVHLLTVLLYSFINFSVLFNVKHTPITHHRILVTSSIKVACWWPETSAR